MKATVFVASINIFGYAMANILPARMGVEVIRSESNVMVREVPRELKPLSCTNCVHVGGECTIGEGNCYGTENALCTDCGNGRVICVDQDGGSCEAP